MKKFLEMPVNKNAETAWSERKFTTGTVVMMLLSRIVLFVAFQLCFFAAFLVLGASDPWMKGASCWPFVAVLANAACALLLSRLYRREGTRFLDFFMFRKGTILKDLLVSLGLLVVVGTIGFMPSILLGNWFFGDVMVGNRLFFQPLPAWAAVGALVLFPLSMPFGELTTYFGYVMPRLELATKSRALAVALPALLLSLQHGALPLLFNLGGMFLLWRALVFLPFAFALALIVRWRPRLLPYLLVGHALIDIGTAAMFFTPMG